MLLTESARRVRNAGFEIGNVAVQVIGNRPKLAQDGGQAPGTSEQIVTQALDVVRGLGYSQTLVRDGAKCLEICLEVLHPVTCQPQRP